MKRHSTIIQAIIAALIFSILFSILPAYATQKSFGTVLYTGTGGTQSITGLGFKPDLVWIKTRNAAYNHVLFDSVRGFNSRGRLIPNVLNAADGAATTLPETTDDGFIVGSANAANGNGKSYVAWCWKADQTGVSNTTQTERYSPESGLSIIKYTGDGNGSRVINHSLGIAPKFIIYKDINNSQSWRVWTSDLSSGKNVFLDLTNSQTAASNRIDSADATSINLVGSDMNTSGNECMLYAFSEISGFSKFGSYTGNGSATGPVIDCGFEPAYVMVKRTDSSDNWGIYDITRNPDGTFNAPLYANTNQIEDTSMFSTVSTSGFTVSTTSAMVNASGGTYIYIAFVETEEPAITFTTDKATIDFDLSETATLSWDVQYAEPFTVELTPGYGVVSAIGSQQVSPVAPTTYTLTVTSNGQTFTEQININVINGGYDHAGTFTVEEKIGVGVLNPTHALEVNGIIKAKEIIVTTDGWADYVFDDGYKLKPLDEVKQFIKENKHLPGIPPEKMVVKEGVNISQMLSLHMKKIEELSLYVLQLKEVNDELKHQNYSLKKRIEVLENE